MTRDQIVEQIKKLENYKIDEECNLLKNIYTEHLNYLREKLKEIGY